MAELPVFRRHLATTDDGTVFGPPGSIYTGKLISLGDLQLDAMYSGFLSNATGIAVIYVGAMVIGQNIRKSTERSPE
ncbi:MAG: hypothetical protein ABSC92_13940 [Rhizomicrobium sp.]|jgi:hypothetical protein